MIENDAKFRNTGGACQFGRQNIYKTASSGTTSVSGLPHTAQEETGTQRGAGWRKAAEDREREWQEYQKEQRRRERLEEKIEKEKKHLRKMRKKKQLEALWQQKSEERKARNRQLLAKSDKQREMNRKLLKKSIDSKDQYRKLCLEKAEQQELLKAALIRRYHERFLFSDKERMPILMETGENAPLYEEKAPRCISSSVHTAPAVPSGITGGGDIL